MVLLFSRVATACCHDITAFADKIFSFFFRFHTLFTPCHCHATVIEAAAITPAASYYYHSHVIIMPCHYAAFSPPFSAHDISPLSAIFITLCFVA